MTQYSKRFFLHLSPKGKFYSVSSFLSVTECLNLVKCDVSVAARELSDDILVRVFDRAGKISEVSVVELTQVWQILDCVLEDFASGFGDVDFASERSDCHQLFGVLNANHDQIELVNSPMDIESFRRSVDFVVRWIVCEFADVLQ